MQTCPQCGSPVAVNALLCPKCGRPNVSTAFAGSYPTPSPLYSPPSEAQPPAEQPSEGQAAETVSPQAAAARQPVSSTVTPQVIPDPPQPIAGSGGASASHDQGHYAPSALPAGLQPGPVYPNPDSNPEALDQALDSLPPAGQPIRVMTGSDTPIPVSLPAHPRQAPPASQARKGHQNVQDQPSAQERGQANWTYSVRPRKRVTDVASQRDPRIAFLLELLAYVGFLGVGHIYGGQVKRGFGLMVAWWITLWAIVPGLGNGAACLVLAPLFVAAASGFWIWYEMGGNEQQ